jgi:hypothetical protein
MKLLVPLLMVATTALADPERPTPSPAGQQTVQASGAGSQNRAVSALGACASTEGFRTGFENNEVALQTALWSDAATWGGAVPAAGQNVTIPQGRRVVLDVQTPVLGEVQIQGELWASHLTDVRLQAKLISVSGVGSRFNIGCAQERYPRAAEIVLYGANLSAQQISAAMKGVLVSGGGKLQLFGENRTSWTKLAANVAVGATTIQLTTAPQAWRAGDELVIAPSGHDAEDLSRVRIASIAGTTVTLQSGVQFAHWGQLQSYGGKTLDQRAEVGLLSRNIVVRGAGDANAEKLGGHIMVMDANAQLDGVEMRSMGQAGHPGRYPFHWHLSGERANDFVRNSSIHSSFQRAVVVHQTNGVLVENNVAFDISNHAFVWAEDGNEQRNRFLGNLAILVRSPAEEDFAFPIDNILLGNTSQAEFRSASFWGRSFGHTLIGNVAAGSVDGMGFFFDRFSGGLGDDEGRGLVFTDNVAHSHYRPGSNAVAGEIYPEATFGHGLMFTSNTGVEEHQVLRYTGYKNYGGAWLEDRRTRMRDSILADNGAGAILLRGVVDDVVVVGQSANTIGGVAPRIGGFGTGLSGAVHLPSSHGGARAPKILNVQVFNQRDAALTWDVDEVGDGTEVRNLRISNTTQRFGFNEAIPIEYSDTQATVDDPEGALLDGATPTRWFKRRDHNVSAQCTAVLGVTNAYACPPAQSFMIRLRNAPSRWTQMTTERGSVHGLGQPWYFDVAMEQPNLGTLMNAQRYHMQWDADSERRTLEFDLLDSNGKWAELTWPVNSATISVNQNASSIAAAISLAGMRASSVTSYFYDAIAQRLHVKMVGGTNTQRINVNASFVRSLTMPGRPALSVTANPVPGMLLDRYSAVPQRLRNAAPSSAPSSSAQSNVSILTLDNAAALLQSGAGTTAIRGYINAPVAGIYRVALPTAGGAADLYVGEQWVTGSRDNRYPVIGNVSGDSFGESALLALEAGWHAITIVYVREGDQLNFGQAMWLRWQLPGQSTNDDVPIYRLP